MVDFLERKRVLKVGAIGFVFFLTMIQEVFSQDPTTYWGGSTSTDWTDPTNWSSGVPTSTEDAEIDVTTPNPCIISSGSQTCAQLAVNGNFTISGGSLTSSPDLTLPPMSYPGNNIGNGGGANAFMTVSGPGTWTVNPGVVNPNPISVGNYTATTAAVGTLTINLGGKVHSPNGGYIGNYAQPGSTGLVTGNLFVEGAGSEWVDVTAINLGNNPGTVGNATITNGGKVSSHSILVGGSEPNATQPGSLGTVTVNTGGQLVTIPNAGPSPGDAIIVGRGTGTSTTACSITVGDTSGGSGTVTSSSIVIGNSNSNTPAFGTLTINNGTVSTPLVVVPISPGIFAAEGAGSHGTIEITTSNGHLLAAGYFIGSDGGIGVLDVGFGTATAASVTGEREGISGFIIGNSGGSSGTFLLHDGAVATSVFGNIAWDNHTGVAGMPTVGTATVDGVGTLWSISQKLTLGNVVDPTIGLIATGTLTIQNNGTVTAPTVVLGAQTGCSGTLNLNSSGVLITNSIVGGTGLTHLFQIDGGTIQVQNSNNADFITGFNPGEFQFLPGGATIDTQAFTIGTSNAMSGPGGLTKKGSGTLTLRGSNTYTGLTTIEEGKLSITGTVGGSVVVNSGATLSPGVSATTSLTINTHLDLTSGSIYSVEINPSSSAFAQVGGVTMLQGGTVVVNQDEGNYPFIGSYNILFSNGGFTGSLNPIVQGGLPGFNFSLLPLSNIIQLFYRKSGYLSGISGNALNYASYLNNNAPFSQAEVLLSSLSGSALQNALIAANPARNAFNIFVTSNMLFSASNLLSSHFSGVHYNHIFKKTGPLDLTAFADISVSEKYIASTDDEFLSNEDNTYGEDLPLGHSEEMGRSESNDLWVGSFVNFANQDAKDQNPSFDFNSEGAFVGYDYLNCPETAYFGGAIGYIRSDFKDHHHLGHGDIHSFVLAPYGMAYAGDFYLELMGAFSVNWVESERHVIFPGFDGKAKNSHRTYQVMPHLGLGYDIAFCNVVLEPFATLDLVVNSEEEFTEHGGSPYNVKQKGHTSEMLRSVAGLNFYQNWQYCCGILVLRETVAYVSKAPFGVGKVTGALVGFPGSFTLESFKDNQNLITYGVSAMLKGETGFYGMLSYDGEALSGYFSNNAQVKLGKFF